MKFALDDIIKNVNYDQSRLSEGVFRDGVRVSIICSMNQWNGASSDCILEILNDQLSEEKGKKQKLQLNSEGKSAGIK
ncbi:hypothetical protein FRZ06_20320 [Anoxybacterium hadale]|uniref:Uncharacterized protein n=1 Tax=Anoxybacterium hadale TaxID=3408580 RepID=A0ACD1AGL9_9FIRM|nr:hypothetical protein FRZ06_20320 [Clostridiales bacterium]